MDPGRRPVVGLVIYFVTIIMRQVPREKINRRVDEKFVEMSRKILKERDFRDVNKQGRRKSNRKNNGYNPGFLQSLCCMSQNWENHCQLSLFLQNIVFTLRKPVYLSSQPGWITAVIVPRAQRWVGRCVQQPGAPSLQLPFL